MDSIISYLQNNRIALHPERGEMSKGKEVKRRRGDILRERLIPQGTQPEQTAEQLAEVFADEVAEEIRHAFAETIHSGEHVKQEMVDEVIKRARSLAYSVALRKIGSFESKSDSHEDEEAIKEIGKWLVTLTGLRGAPAIKREQGIQALEKHLSGMTWMELTTEICDCGSSEHTGYCKERIRHQALELLRLLRKYEIGDVPELDQDRSKRIKESLREKRETEERLRKLK